MEKWVKRKMTVVGLRTLQELKGENCIEIEQTLPAKKSIISSRTFGEYLTNINEMKEAVAFFTARAAEKMRSQSSAAKMLSVFIRTNPFKNAPQYYNSVQISLPHSRCCNK
jgi:DNA polymerase V